MPRLLDLFCGAGGAAMGYHQAGFDEIVGVDIAPQPHYPFEFVQADALAFAAEHGHEFDAIHASPPCQAYSQTRFLPWVDADRHPKLIPATRDQLTKLGKPYVIENVMGAHLEAGWLCGTMFGLPFYRHRAFETNFFWFQPAHPIHRIIMRPGRLFKDRLSRGHAAIGCDWMNARERAQAIPPQFTLYVGKYLLDRSST